MKKFKGKVAAITGAGSGIGRALALDLAARGCNLAITDIDGDRVAETARLASSSGVRITSGVLDVADRDAIYAWADEVVSDHGKVNLIFNNAGVALGGTVEGTSDEDYEWLMNINFWGVVHGTRAFIPKLKESGEGHIINVSSLFGLISVPTQSAYNAAKFAVRGFTESLRMELDLSYPNVSATCVHPGGIKTRIAKDGRMDPSLQKITGKTPEQSTAEFEKKFITTPESAAATIIKAVQRDSRRVLIGPDAKAIASLQRLFPTGYQKIVAKQAQK